MKVKVLHALPAGEVAYAGATKARRVYCTNRALAQVADSLHTPTHTMLLTWEEGELIVDPTAPFRRTIVGRLSPGSLHMRVKADVVLAVSRVTTALEDLRFDTADDVETLDEFGIDENDLGGTAGDGR